MHSKQCGASINVFLRKLEDEPLPDSGAKGGTPWDGCGITFRAGISSGGLGSQIGSDMSRAGNQSDGKEVQRSVCYDHVPP